MGRIGRATVTAAAAVAFLLGGCAADPDRTAGAAGSREVAGPGPQERAEREMAEADRAFDAMAAERGIAAAFAAFAEDGATLLRDGTWAPVVGRDAIRETFAAAGPDDRLRWAPEQAVASAAGDLGYTWGRWVFEGVGEDGEPHRSQGKYLTVWRRQDDGNWKYVLDTGNSNPAGP